MSIEKGRKRALSYKSRDLTAWLRFQEGLHFASIELGLERVKSVFHRLFPHDLPYQVIVVGGTNGKGSTTLFIDVILNAIGDLTGRFTSPHINVYNERFATAGKIASDRMICDACSEVEEARAGQALTYFEFSTLCAFVLFARAKCSTAIMEVGLGGRLDAVNIINPALCVITNVEMDHMEYLGNTRELIGHEKAGILRRNVPLVSACQTLPKSVLSKVNRLSIPLYLASTPFPFDLGLRGEHQRQNASCSLLAAEVFSGKKLLHHKGVQTALAHATLPGRMQLLKVGEHLFILDVCHNVAAACVLVQELRQNSQPTLAIFAALADKDIAGIVKTLEAFVDCWWAVPIEGERGLGVSDQRARMGVETEAFVSAGEAIQQALDQKRYMRVLVFGSFFLVGEALRLVER